MEMIERYIYAVVQKLPQDQRKDIANELRGLIEDMLEERVNRDNIQKSDIEEVLLELGNPRLLADKYRGTKKYLIGPELFDTYLLVLKIVLIVIGALIGVGFLIQTILDPISILDHFIDMIISIFTAFPMAFGWTTFSFALGEFFGGMKQKDLTGQEWKPSDLPPIPDEKRQIKRGESIAGIIFYVIFMLFLPSNYFGVWVFHDEFTGVIPFLNDETYKSYFMFIILIFGLGILKECIKLVIGKWTYLLAIYTTIINAMSTVAILLIINGPDFWNPTFMSELVNAGVISAGSEAFDVVTKIWDQMTFWIFVLLIIGIIWETIGGFFKARKK